MFSSVDIDSSRPLFIVNTPSQAHTWRHVIRELLDSGRNVKILARDYGGTPRLLTAFGFEFSTFQPVGSQLGRLAGALKHFASCYRLARHHYPSLIIGFGLDAAVTAFRFKKPCIVFFDDEHTVFQNRVTTALATWVVTPDTFEHKLARNHIRVNGYKELAYLHPAYFQPDISVYDELGLPPGQPYVMLRFNLMDAIHDIGMHKLGMSSQIELVREFEKYARVFVSPEGELPRELEKNRLPIRYDRIHHALSFAHLLVSNSCTMTTEAAILGTPAVRVHPIVGRGTDPTIFSELERRYDMTYSFSDPASAIRKAIELISRPGLKKEWACKRARLLEDKIDMTKFMLNFIEHGPQGITERVPSSKRRKVFSSAT